MERVHSPRFLALVLAILFVVIFVFGTSHTFAALRMDTTPTFTSIVDNLTDTPTNTEPTITPIASTQAPTSTEPFIPFPVSGETTGIIILSVVLVAIIIFGVLWGKYITRSEKPKQFKKKT